LFAARPTVAQAARAIIDSVTPFERKFAVFREAAFPGQEGRSKAFWAALCKGKMWEEARLLLPLMVGVLQLRKRNGSLARKRKTPASDIDLEAETHAVSKDNLLYYIKNYIARCSSASATRRTAAS
jgi:hypothetical protein